MKRLRLMLGAVVVAAVVAAACGGGNEPVPPTESAPAAAPAPATGPVEVTLKTEPEAPRMGENTFEVMVMQGGQPVTDAEVEVMLFMAAMPEMKMAEMKNSVALKHEGDGRYRGAGNVMMAGKWDATVMVMRSGQELGSEKVTITAK